MAGLDSSEASKPFSLFIVLELVTDQESQETETRELIVAKQGKSYAPEVRKLYYSLLADKVPAYKIANIIRTVLKTFEPEKNCSYPSNRTLPHHGIGPSQGTTPTRAGNRYAVTTTRATALSMWQAASLSTHAFCVVAPVTGQRSAQIDPVQKERVGPLHATSLCM